MTLLIVLVGDWVGGRNGMVYALVIAGVMNFVSYFFSDKIALAMYRAQSVTRADVAIDMELLQRLMTSKYSKPLVSNEQHRRLRTIKSRTVSRPSQRTARSGLDVTLFGTK